MKKKIIGNVIELFQSKEKTDKLVLDKDGIIGDKFYAKNLNRSVLLIPQDSYSIVQTIGLNLDAGTLGENILINFNPYIIPLGTKLYIGNVVLEFSQNCTLCKSLSKLDSKLPKLLKNDRGVFAKVIKEGIIHKNDEIFIGEDL